MSTHAQNVNVAVGNIPHLYLDFQG